MSHVARCTSLAQSFQKKAQKLQMRNRPLCRNGELRSVGSSRTIIEFNHKLHPRHRLRRIHLFLWIQQKYEVTRKLHETVAKEWRDTATWKIFRRGWRSPQMIWRTQKMHAPASTSHDSDPERPIRVASRKHSIKIHFPEDRNCDGPQANQDDKGSLQKAYWRSSTSSREVW